MIDMSYVASEIESVLAMFNGDEFPETRMYLSGLIADENEPERINTFLTFGKARSSLKSAK